MLKNKRILLILIIALALFLIPSVCNAAAITATETTTTSTEKTVKWSYELEGESIVNLKCTNPSTLTGSVTIPSTIDGYTVVGLGGNGYSEGIFQGSSGITGITIPNTVTTIGYKAFYNCVGLKNITIPDSVTSIGSYAFHGNTGLTSVTLSSNLSTIGSYAFYECTGLTSITFSDSISSIGTSAFYGAKGLKSLIIPDSVTTIGESAFRYCTGLTNITLSKNLTSIKDKTFEGCTGLTSVIIPDSVTTIEGDYSNIYGAFGECKKLKKVLIPDSVASIGQGAFQGCSDVTIYGNDGQASKTYAETYGYNFDYIANWDKGTSGSDIAAPIIESLYVKYSSVMEYWDTNTNTYRVPTNGQIIICLEFNEDISGKTAPELTIKFGVGNNIKLNSGVINGKSATYNYTVKSTDEGLISCVSLSGGDITDLAGNKAEITSTKITTQYQSGSNIVYANGSSVPADNNNSQGNQQSVTLVSIAITKAPTKTTYTVGESFNKSGMVVTATYSDGSKKVITNYTVSPSGALKTTDKKVTITYTENGVIKAAEQSITVKEKITINSNNKDDNNKKEDTNKNNANKDNTIKNDNKLPQTGITVISLAVISLLAVALISKVRYGKYKDI